MTNGEEFHSLDRGWRAKFRDAFRGVARGVHDQSSFRVHFAAAALVLIAAALLNLDRTQWCLLILAITGVLVAEMFNTALEHLAKAVDRTRNPDIGSALDIGSAAVLLAAAGAVVVGAVILGLRLLSIVVLACCAVSVGQKLPPRAAGATSWVTAAVDAPRVRQHLGNSAAAGARTGGVAPVAAHFDAAIGDGKAWRPIGPCPSCTSRGPRIP